MSVPTVGADDPQDGAAELAAVPPDAAPRAFRVLAVAAVCLGVAVLAAATFVLSYSAIRAVALQAGITPRLAKDYPLLLDAMLVIVLAAVLALRGAGLPSRLLAWVTLLLVMTVAAGADALHTAGGSLPHQTASITAAVLPFVLVLIAFALLLAMLRHVRLSRLASTASFVAAHGSPSVDYSESMDHSDEVDDGEEPHDSEEAEDFGVTLTAVASLSTEGAEEENIDDLDGPVFHRLFSAPTPEPPTED